MSKNNKKNFDIYTNELYHWWHVGFLAHELRGRLQ